MILELQRLITFGILAGFLLLEMPLIFTGIAELLIMQERLLQVQHILIFIMCGMTDKENNFKKD